MLALRLPKDIEERLDALAKRTGRTKSYYARKAIVEMMEDLEDIALAREVLAEGGERYSLEEVKAMLANDE
jgi:RHH-type rel operon transcriptional repressor/antitoxin RelB